MSVCRFQQVSKCFRTGMLLRRIPVLDDISFSVEPGETFAYLGHNGAGKTTTIKALLGLIRVEGTVEIHGQAPGSVAARARTGYLPENPYFYDHLTGREFLELAAQLHGLPRADSARRVDEVLDLVGMRDRQERRLRTCSKGMLQRIGLAQALIGDPDLVILDEPMGGLDPVGRAQVRGILEELRRRGKTLFMSSHILADVESLADRAAILVEGRLRRVVDLNDLRQEDRMMVVHARGLREDVCQSIAAQQLKVEEAGQAQRIPVADPAMVSWVVDQVVSSGAQLLQVAARRRSLEDIFLQEVGAPAGLPETSTQERTLEEAPA